MGVTTELGVVAWNVECVVVREKRPERTLAP